jgi:hypothetical protein
MEILIVAAPPLLAGWGRGFCGLCGLILIADYDFNMIYMMAMIT